MTIKADRWIRRMAAQGMIEPFAPEQVRSIDGRRIVSYGTSSYGYDVRCASEFKIFTNINSTIVDPKAFDPQSFVDVTADVCIIPPNSFALARTVEYFRIPRSVLTVCLGKCVTGDTRVVDVDTGDYLPITAMRFGRRTLALDAGRLRPARVSAFMAQGRKPVFELRTRAGLRIVATANHPFLRCDGWVALEDLRPGDRIAIAREIPVFGRTPLAAWEATLLGLLISAGRCHAPGHEPTFTTGDSVLADALRTAVADSGFGEVSFDGVDGHRLVDRDGRSGVPERATAWLERHGLAVGAGEQFVPSAVFRAPREDVRTFLRALFSGGGGIDRGNADVYLAYCSPSRRLIEDVHHLLLRFGVFGLVREQTTGTVAPAWSLQITDPEQVAKFARDIGCLPGSIEQLRLESELLPWTRARRARARRRGSVDAQPNGASTSLGVAACAAGTMSSPLAVVVHPGTQSVPLAAARAVATAIDEPGVTGLPSGAIWDVVSEIVPAGEAETYDIEVPGPHNFVANGIVVHNSTYARCGIIVNVTPLEPEWEGHVTLEFSNTTPLPAKIYANEGVAQMLFLESDEVCETSYKDRGGKYQGQKGVTLPKT